LSPVSLRCSVPKSLINGSSDYFCQGTPVSTSCKAHFPDARTRIASTNARQFTSMPVVLKRGILEACLLECYRAYPPPHQ
ncbi:hypothetical protein K523DRAFT_404709, partial [Schizophyllum commune Tattone D]